MHKVQQTLPQCPGYHHTKSDIPTASLTLTCQGQILRAHSSNLTWPCTIISQEFTGISAVQLLSVTLHPPSPESRRALWPRRAVTPRCQGSDVGGRAGAGRQRGPGRAARSPLPSCWGRDGPQQSQSHRRATQSHSSASAVTQLATEGHSVTEMLT